LNGFGPNPQPVDYEKYGATLRVRCLHRYHAAVPQMALIAPLARVTRSTNRSTVAAAMPTYPVTVRNRQRVGEWYR